MFQLEKNVPEYYVQQSRDFQLMCRVFDILHISIRENINTIIRQYEANKCKQSFLKYLCSRAGFFTNVDIDDTTLRAILSVFPYAVKKKGSKAGIRAAVNAVLRTDTILDVEKGVIIEYDKNNFLIKIRTPIEITKKRALTEFLKYIIPVGCYYEMSVYSGRDVEDEILIGGSVTAVQTTNARISAIRGSNTSFKLNPNDATQQDNEFIKAAINKSANTYIVSSSNYNAYWRTDEAEVVEIQK